MFRHLSATPDPPPAPPPPADPAEPALLVTPGRNLPDPFILATGQGLFLYSSQTGFSTPPVSVARATTLDHWGPSTAALSVDPPWATFGYTWSPDVREIDGRYVMYYDAMADTARYDDTALPGFEARVQCIGTATATAPAGPFTPQSEPLLCDDAAHGAIDPRTFARPSGQLWLDWKSDQNALLDSTTPTDLYAQRLSPDGLALAGPPNLLLSADEAWQDGDHIVEAPDMVQAGGGYWLFYSGSWFEPAVLRDRRGPVRRSGRALSRPVDRGVAGLERPGERPGGGVAFQRPRRLDVDRLLAVVLGLRGRGHPAGGPGPRGLRSGRPLPGPPGAPPTGGRGRAAGHRPHRRGPPPGRCLTGQFFNRPSMNDPLPDPSWSSLEGR